MTKTMFKGALCMAAVGLSVASCTDGTGWGFDTGKGSVSLIAGMDTRIEAPRNSRAESEYPFSISASDLQVRLTSQGDGKVSTWESLEAFGEKQSVATGAYKFEVFYGDDNAEGFDAPQFYGIQDNVRVRENEETSVLISAQLTNAILSIDYSENFLNYMSAYGATVVTAAGNTFEYAAGETRDIFIQPGRTTVTVDFTKPNGKSGSAEVASFEAVARRYYHLTVDMDETSGTAFLTVELEDALSEVTVDLEISDEALSSPAPQLEADGFGSEAVEFIAGHYDGNPLAVNAIAQAGLKSVVLSTTSTSLIAQGWPESIDLLAATAQEQATLKNLGLSARGVFTNPDKMAVLEFSDVLNHIAYVTGDAHSNISEFTVNVTDKYGKTAEPVTLTAQAYPLELTLSNGEAYDGFTDVSFDMAYNAGDPSQVTFTAWNPNEGAERQVPVVSVSPISRSIGSYYRVTVSLVQTTGDVTVTATDGALSSQLSIERSPLATPGAANSFAKYAYIPVSEQGDVSAASIWVSTDGTNYTKPSQSYDASARAFCVEGLTPSTAYKFKMQNGSLRLEGFPAYALNTEDDAQIPNGNLDADVSVVSSQSLWQNIAFEGWGTNNTMTTSEGGNFAYVRISGTIATDDSHSGKAALVRTVGWGSGNSAYGTMVPSTLQFVVCKYTDAGLLHLGSTRTTRPSGYGSGENKLDGISSVGPVTTDDLDCGIAFASRPKSVSFWYKYSPKNASDRGYAEIWVKDAAGNIVDRQTALLDAKDSYKQETIKMNYNVASAKGAKVYVKFLSSYDMQYFSATSANFTPPAFGGNLGKATYMSSQLYIDDVTFNY